MAAAILVLGCQGGASPGSVDAGEEREVDARGGTDSRVGAEPPAAKDARVEARAEAAAPDASVADAFTPEAAVPDSAEAEPEADARAPSDAGAEWARGVQVGLVEAAQAVFIKIGEGATVVPPAMRNSTLIEGRAAFARVHVRVDAGWKPRPLRAVLTLAYADGSKQELADERIISEASTTEKLESSFNFLWPAEAVKPAMTLAVSIYETGAAAGAEPALLPRFPPAGAADLAVAAGPMLMEVVLLPVLGPSGPLDDAPARRKRLESYLADVYPVQKMTIRWHEPLKITTVINSSVAFKMMQTARKQDNAAPGAYYHMLIAAEDCSDKYLGLGSGAGFLPSDAPNRIAMTMVTDHQVDSQMDTVAHEMGHNLGRDHAPGCDAAGVDPKFPYANTGVGVDGYSIPESAWKSRKKWKDVMGYCYPTWISDYTWNGFAVRVRIVTAFAIPHSLTAPLRSLQGFYAPGRTPAWGVVAGKLVPEGTAATAQRWARIVRADGTSATVPIAVSLLRSPAGPEAGSRMIAIDLPGESRGDAGGFAAEVPSREVWSPARVPDRNKIVRVEAHVDGERFVVGGADLAAP